MRQIDLFVCLKEVQFQLTQVNFVSIADDEGNDRMKKLIVNSVFYVKFSEAKNNFWNRSNTIFPQYIFLTGKTEPAKILCREMEIPINSPTPIGKKEVIMGLSIIICRFKDYIAYKD